MKDAAPPSPDEALLIEITSMGSVLKVTAIDPRTGQEVSIVGDPNASLDHMSSIAAQKLRRALKAPNAPTPPPQPTPPRKRGLMV